MVPFVPADILLPKNGDLERWAVIACDQFTADPAYWQRVRRTAGDAPSAIHLILPEAELENAGQSQTICSINKTMERYLHEQVFALYPRCYIYVERTLEDGSVRPGLVGAVDLEQYDYHVGSHSPIRATEKTVLERIPPRQKVRKDAALELPHVLMLCDDDRFRLIEPITAIRDSLPKLYDFELMEQGGHIRGWLVSGDVAEEFDRRFQEFCAECGEKYTDLTTDPVILAVGDGNHSLATAKSCYEALKKAHPGEDLSAHPARFSLVELENIHDPALKFAPIHRILTKIDPERLLEAISEICAEGGYPVRWVAGQRSGTVFLDRRKGELAVAAPWITYMATKKFAPWRSSRRPWAFCCPPWKSTSFSVG